MHVTELFELSMMNPTKDDQKELDQRFTSLMQERKAINTFDFFHSLRQWLVIEPNVLKDQAKPECSLYTITLLLLLREDTAWADITEF